MNTDPKNLILAISLSMLILVGYDFFLAPKNPTPPAGSQSVSQFGDSISSAVPSAIPQVSSAIEEDLVQIINAPRVLIESNTIEGSLSLAGGRIDDIRLKEFKASSDEFSPQVSVMRRVGSPDAYFAEMFFTAFSGELKRSISRTHIWNLTGRKLTPNTPVTLTTSEDGIDYAMTYSIDDGYMITVTGIARNTGTSAAMIGTTARIQRQRPGYSEWISYAGPMGYFNEESGSVFFDYDDIEKRLDCREDERICSQINSKSWIGASDKDWLTAIIPAEGLDNGFIFRPANLTDIESIRHLITPQNLAEINAIRTGNRAEGVGTPLDISANRQPSLIPPNGEMRWQYQIFAGPKKYTILDHYQNMMDIPRFTAAIDWGWMEFLARPMLVVLIWVNQYISNFGIAILVMTVGIKLVFFPLAHKSYHSMAKMRALTPKIKEMRERFSDDRQRQQQATMELYRQEKINPAAGCLPILLQIPVFFALYKVLYVTIEMRHAPFFGWITDLSSPDPTSLFNLFGILPYSTAFLPDFINIGLWPLLMGITMFVQMSLNPPPPDPVQAQIFRFMPLMFTFLLATFPAGLVIYWTWNNLLSIIQQWYIMRSYQKQIDAQKDGAK